jgi:hypothetical protein
MVDICAALCFTVRAGFFGCKAQCTHEPYHVLAGGSNACRVSLLSDCVGVPNHASASTPRHRVAHKELL